jgi:hypothetical protein
MNPFQPRIIYCESWGSENTRHIYLDSQITLMDLTHMHSLLKQGEVKDRFINQAIGGRSSTGDIGQNYSFG